MASFWAATRLVLYIMIVRRFFTAQKMTHSRPGLTQWIFSVILIGFTSSRIHFTHATASFYEPITAEILSTSIIALLWTTFMMLFLGLRVGGIAASFIVENFFNFCIWVLYLVGNAVFSHKFAHIGQCRRGAETCRILTGVMAFGWINWAFFTFLIILSVGHMATAGASPTDPSYSEKANGGPEIRERV